MALVGRLCHIQLFLLLRCCLLLHLSNIPQGSKLDPSLFCHKVLLTHRRVMSPEQFPNLQQLEPAVLCLNALFPISAVSAESWWDNSASSCSTFTGEETLGSSHMAELTVAPLNAGLSTNHFKLLSKSCQISASTHEDLFGRLQATEPLLPEHRQ